MVDTRRLTCGTRLAVIFMNTLMYMCMRVRDLRIVHVIFVESTRDNTRETQLIASNEFLLMFTNQSEQPLLKANSLTSQLQTHPQTDCSNTSMHVQI